MFKYRWSLNPCSNNRWWIFPLERRSFYIQCSL